MDTGEKWRMAEKERWNKNSAQRTIFRISVCFTELIQIFEFIFPLKVHKREKFFGSDFEFFTIL